MDLRISLISSDIYFVLLTSEWICVSSLTIVYGYYWLAAPATISPSFNSSSYYYLG